MTQAENAINEKTLSSAKVAREFGVKNETVIRWAKIGIIPRDIWRQNPGTRGRFRFRPQVIDFIRSWHTDHRNAVASC